MAYLCRNIDNASELKFWPGVMFSSQLEMYINELANVHSIHPDSLSVVLINCVAATLEFYVVLRVNSMNNKIPTNLFNIIVTRSCKFCFHALYLTQRIIHLAYGKSDLTKLLRDMLKAVVMHRPAKFRSNSQMITGNMVNPTLDETSKPGLMSGLDDSCRTIICDEADMTFAHVGLFLSDNGCRSAAEMK